MNKILIAAGLILALAATSAQASSINLDGVKYAGRIGAAVSFTVDSGELKLRVENTSSLDSFLTSLLFTVPSGVSLALTGTMDAQGNDVIITKGKKTYEWQYAYDGGGDFPNLGNSSQYSDYLDDVTGLLFTKNGFNGGETALGIPRGEWFEFAFALSGDVDSLGPYVARFQGIPVGVGSDFATPTPIPGAAWLLGSGLLGLAGLRRRFAK